MLRCLTLVLTYRRPRRVNREAELKALSAVRSGTLLASEIVTHKNKNMTKIAWATKSLSNGKIVRWSRWHIVYNTAGGTVTLCGIGVPHTKWLLGGKEQQVKGGHCAACRAADKARYPKPLKASAEPANIGAEARAPKPTENKKL